MTPPQWYPRLPAEFSSPMALDDPIVWPETEPIRSPSGSAAESLQSDPEPYPISVSVDDRAKIIDIDHSSSPYQDAPMSDDHADIALGPPPPQPDSPLRHRSSTRAIIPLSRSASQRHSASHSRSASLSQSASQRASPQTLGHRRTFSTRQSSSYVTSARAGPSRAGSSQPLAYSTVLKSPPSQLPRPRPAITSPDHRRVPSSQANIGATQRLQDAVRSVRPMPRVGTQVTRDAERAIARRVADEANMATRERRYGLISFPNLLVIKPLVQSWCYWCISRRRSDEDVEDVVFTTHKITGCRHSKTHKDFKFSKLPACGRSYSSIRDEIRNGMLPVDCTICYFCLWPWSMMHLHPRTQSGTGTTNACTSKDFILPMCWVLLANTNCREELRVYFKLPQRVVDDASEFFKWCADTDRDVNWAGAATKMYNFHRVLLWAVLVFRNYRPPGDR
jgi:hypothetical protein